MIGKMLVADAGDGAERSLIILSTLLYICNIPS